MFTSALACVRMVMFPSEFSTRKFRPPASATVLRKSRRYSSRADAVIAQQHISRALIPFRIFQPLLQCLLLVPIQRRELILQIDVVTIVLDVRLEVRDG